MSFLTHGSLDLHKEKYSECKLNLPNSVSMMCLAMWSSLGETLGALHGCSMTCHIDLGLGDSRESFVQQKRDAFNECCNGGLSMIWHVCPVQFLNDTEIAWEVDAAAVGEQCAMIVECKRTLNYDAAMQLRFQLLTIP